MKKLLLLPFALGFAFIAGAQEEKVIKEEKEVKEEKVREEKAISHVRVTGRKLSDTTIKRINRDQAADQKVITLRFKGDKAENQKYTIEVDGDKIKINGKDISEIKDVDVSVGRNRMYFNRGAGNFQAFGADGPIEVRGMSLDQLKEMNLDQLKGMNLRDKWMQDDGKPKAFLGVGMEKSDIGVRITSVTENSAAEKAGLKKDDIITSIDGKKVVAEMEVTNMIKAHKPGEQVEVAYNREGKDNKAKATLGEREDDISYWYNDGGQGGNLFGTNGQKFEPKFDMNNMPDMKRTFEYKLTPGFEMHSDGKGEMKVIGMSRPRLGVNVKETESGKGLEVTNVDDNSAAAKAGLKKGDIITEVAGKPVSSVDDVRKLVAESKSKPFNVNYTRDGSSKTTEIKFPKDLKETGL